MNRIKIVCALLLVCLLSFKVFGREPTPVMFTDLNNEIDLSRAIPWVSPDYRGQEKALGYADQAFQIPKGMEQRVQFWLDVYTKFTTEQGILHDSQYVHIVYETVDFTEIDKNGELSDKQKSTARRKLVDDAKKRIVDRLHRLEKVKSAEGLDGEDLRYWQLFSIVEEQNKFFKAAKKGRLRFQLGQKDRFVKGIYYSGRYLPYMEEIFKSMNLPIELTRLPFVESSFNFRARSKVGASGIWQFMRSSGKLYMKIDGSVDERNEPLKATESAAKMLKSNFQMLENWPLAVTGYNHGPAGVRRLVRKYQTDRLEEMIDVRKGRFGFASANFYASFLAALEAEKNADKYYGLVYREKPLEYQKLTLNRSINAKTLLDWFSGDLVQAKTFNPHLTSYFWKGYRLLSKSRYVLLPPQKAEMARQQMNQLKEQRLTASKASTYRVGRGDTLSQIAENFGVSLRHLQDINGIDNPRRIRAGQKLIIPSQ